MPPPAEWRAIEPTISTGESVRMSRRHCGQTKVGRDLDNSAAQMEHLHDNELTYWVRLSMETYRPIPSQEDSEPQISCPDDSKNDSPRLTRMASNLPSCFISWSWKRWTSALWATDGCQVTKFPWQFYRSTFCMHNHSLTFNYQCRSSSARPTQVRVLPACPALLGTRGGWQRLTCLKSWFSWKPVTSFWTETTHPAN